MQTRKPLDAAVGDVKFTVNGFLVILTCDGPRQVILHLNNNDSNTGVDCDGFNTCTFLILPACLSVCLSVRSNIQKRKVMNRLWKFFGCVGQDPSNSPLDSGSDTDHDPDRGIFLKGFFIYY